MEKEPKKPPLITNHMQGVEKEVKTPEEDLRDAVTLLRRGVKHFPEPLKTQTLDWLQRKVSSNILRADLSIGMPIGRIAQNDPELFPWLLGIIHPKFGAGDFLKHLSESALRADVQNYAILRPTLLLMKDTYPKYYEDELKRMIADGYNPDAPENNPQTFRQNPDEFSL